MKKIFLLLMFSVVGISAFCQETDDESDDSTYYAKHMKTATEQFRKKLSKFKEPYQVEFSIDTFKVEEQYRMEIKRHSTDRDVTMAVDKQSKAYDKLLNKYYNKLLNVLDKEDRASLIEAEKGWIAFKNKNESFTDIIMSNKYFGGGTIQNVENISLNMSLVKERLNEIFSYYYLSGRAGNKLVK